MIVSSESVEPGIPPAPPSISTQRHVKRNSVNLILNALDFGLAFIKARQDYQHVIMLVKDLDRARQNLVLDICKAYWKAVANKVGMENSLFDRIAQLQERLGEQMDEQIISATRGLKGTSDLLNLNIQLHNFQNEYSQAMNQLAVFMGLPTDEFELDYPDISQERLELADVMTLEEIALENRPDLFGRDMEQQMALEEARYAFLQMLPGGELFIGNYYDANKYFFNNYWSIAGARAAWNLLSIPWHYYDSYAYDKQQEQIQLQRVSLTVGILAQVRLNHILAHENHAQYARAYALAKANAMLKKTSQEEMELGIISTSDLLFVESQAIFSKVNAYKAYGDFQVALEQLNNAVGLERPYAYENDICTVYP
jgi:outer membrane protein TolC